jgi:Polyketide cyclase / dehydrase and lipid transport
MNTRARCLVALMLKTLLTAACVTLLRYGVYGWTLFVLFPVVLGGLSSWVFLPVTGARAAGMGALAAAASACFLLFLSLEGIICILMALPLVAPLGALGGWLFYLAQSSRFAARGSMMLLLLTPATLTWDVKVSPTVFEVRSEVIVAATPEQVWKHVVSFSTLPAPTEWFFRTGLACPIRARIEGSGPGAIRYCEFSTGPFVEPIELWDEPHLLRFRVMENPARVPGFQAGTVPPYKVAERPNAAARNHLVSTWIVARGILAMVVRRDHSQNPFAGSESCPNAR